MKYTNALDMLKAGYAPRTPQTFFNIFNLGTPIERNGLLAKQGAIIYQLHVIQSKKELKKFLRVIQPTQTATETAIAHANTQTAEKAKGYDDGTLQALIGIWFNDLVFNK